MRACRCLAIAILAVAGCAPDSSLERSASFSAESDMAAVRGYCAGIAVTPEDHANCVASRAALNKCSGIGGDYDDCIAAEHSAVRGVCDAHVVFSEYADCVGIGQNRVGSDWTGPGDE
jgi:hypothetical protein